MTRQARARGIALALLGCAAGCYQLAPPAGQPDLARPAAPIPAVEKKEPQLPEYAEVEVSGRVRLPPGARGQVRVYITAGECFAAGAVALSEQRPSTDTFADEVFVKQGTGLWLCAALVDRRAEQAGRATIYGVAPGVPFLGKGIGEVVFNDVEITLAKGAPVPLPRAAAGHAAP